MAVASFEELRAGICALLGSAVPSKDEELPAGGDAFALVVNGTPVALTHAAEVLPDRAFAFCALGECPEELELQALRRLLEVNFVLYRGSASSFGRDPMSGELVLQCELLFDGATPESALDLLGKMAEQAQVWQRTRFLDVDPSGLNPARGDSQSAWVRG